MKKIILLISIFLIVGIIVIIFLSNNKKEEKKVVDSCCPGCICGDTIKLLKNTETAWNLTELDENGEYVIVKHSFINFHGTGKNKFAFFKNDENSNPISEIRGEMSIKNDEIILTTDNNEVITCKLGEEKDLIAVMNCDNDFGMFTLRKHGKLDLDDSFKETILKTKKIVIKDSYGLKTIKDENDINEFIKIVNSSKIWTGLITVPSPLYEIELFDENNKIAFIQYNPDHYFDIDINNKSYSLKDLDKESLNKLLDKYKYLNE